MIINAKKSQVEHIRNYQKLRSTVNLMCCGQQLDYTSNYKYPGYITHEHLSNDDIIEALTAASTRSFGRIVNIFKSLKNLEINTCETLYQSHVLSIYNYAAGIWGFNDFNSPQVLRNLSGCDITGCPVIQDK